MILEYATVENLIKNELWRTISTKNEFSCEIITYHIHIAKVRISHVNCETRKNNIFSSGKLFLAFKYNFHLTRNPKCRKKRKKELI